MKMEKQTNGLTEIQLNIAKQINARELKFAKFKLIKEKDNIIHIHKGKKFLKITYNKNSDLYDLEIGKLTKDFEIKSEKLEGIYNINLRGYIERHFKGFEYCMESLRFRGY